MHQNSTYRRRLQISLAHDSVNSAYPSAMSTVVMIFRRQIQRFVPSFRSRLQEFNVAQSKTRAMDKLTKATEFRWNGHFNLLTVLCFATMTACSQLSEEECLYLNWHARGVMDGADGAPASKVDEYQSVCAKYSVQVDHATYEEGRQQGAMRYCTRANGFNVGMEGDRYENSCPESVERNFLSGYQPGRLMWSAINNVQVAQSNVRSSTYRIQSIERQIDRLYVDLEDTSLTDKQQSEIRNEIRWGRREIDNERDKRRTNELRIPELLDRCREARERVEDLGFVVADVCY